MLLAIDIGNSRTKLGLYRGSRLIAAASFLTSQHQSRKDVLPSINPMSQKAKTKVNNITDAAVCSVVPKQSKIISSLLKSQFNIRPLLISGKLDIGMKIRYKHPAQLGADRLCSAVAAYDKFGGPCIVIDIGTATKYEVISKRGEHLGGAIALGIESALNALHSRTAQLPKIVLRVPRKVIGTSTAECIQSGNFFGAIDAIDGMIVRLRKIAGKNSKVILTGGFAQLIARHSRNIDYVEPHLVLEGARIIYGRK